jgi:ribokinase
MNYDIISIGSAILDVHVKSASFTVAPIREQLMVCEIYGGKMDVEDAGVSSGGAATNTAVSFARQGFTVGCIARVGVDIAAQTVWDDLHRDGVHTRLLVARKEERTGISSILVAKDGSRSVLTFRGASHHLQIVDIDFDKLEGVRAIHLSSVGNIDLIKKIGEFCKDKRIYLSWNPSKAEAEEIFLKHGMREERFCDVLFLNDLEWEAVRKVENSVKTSAKMLVVTKGKKGGELIMDGKTQLYQAVVAPIVCETGAGDAFASGFVGAHLRGEGLEQCLEFASQNAASVVGFIGAKQGLLRVKKG